MKATFATCVVIGLLVPASFGQGSAIMIKNRAKEVVNQNNVRQGVPPPAPAVPQPTPGNPSASNPATLPAQHVAKIKTDLAGFKTGATATAAQKQQFIKDLAVAARSTKPSLPMVTKSVDSLIAGLSEAVLTSEQQGRLAQNLEAVLNSKPLPASQFKAIIDDVQAIFQVGGVKRSAASSIAADVKAVGNEVRR
jgi:hypothetical protein